MLFLFSYSVVSNSLRHHVLQHSRPPHRSPPPKVCPSSCPLHWWCHPSISSLWQLILLPSSFPSIRDFSKDLTLHIRWPKYWSFSFSIIPSNQYSGLISLTIDWFDRFAVQGPVSLFQHHSLKSSILWFCAFFMVQFSQPYMTTEKALTFSWHFHSLCSPVFVCF